VKARPALSGIRIVVVGVQVLEGVVLVGMLDRAVFCTAR
jgi:hypothetical protein